MPVAGPYEFAVVLETAKRMEEVLGIAVVEGNIAFDVEEMPAVVEKILLAAVVDTALMYTTSWVVASKDHIRSNQSSPGCGVRNPACTGREHHNQDLLICRFRAPVGLGFRGNIHFPW